MCISFCREINTIGGNFQPWQQASIVQVPHIAPQAVHKGYVMRRHDNRNAFFGPQPAYQAFDYPQVLFVHVGSGLVQQQHRRIQTSRSCQGDSLSFPAGQGFGRSVRKVVQVQLLQGV